MLAHCILKSILQILRHRFHQLTGVYNPAILKYVASLTGSIVLFSDSLKRSLMNATALSTGFHIAHQPSSASFPMPASATNSAFSHKISLGRLAILSAREDCWKVPLLTLVDIVAHSFLIRASVFKERWGSCTQPRWLCVLSKQIASNLVEPQLH